MQTTLSGVEQTYQKWTYDARGRATSTLIRVAGHADTSFATAFNSADLVTSLTYPSGEVVASSYDGGWRQTSLCGTTCYVSGATYTALNQPDVVTLGNGLLQDYNYDVRARLSEQKLGPSATPTARLHRSYAYDGTSNVTAITNLLTSQTTTYSYDDPAIGRFVSADTVVPGNASGGMDGIAVEPLTVSFHENQFLGKLNSENQLGFWFQLNDEGRATTARHRATAPAASPAGDHTLGNCGPD